MVAFKHKEIMAVIAPQSAPNFATGEYHKILKAEYQFFPGGPNTENPPEPQLQIHVGFYFNEAARDLNPQNPMWVNVVTVPVKDMTEDHRVFLYDLLMKTPLFAGTNAAPDVQAPAPDPASTETSTDPAETSTDPAPTETTDPAPAETTDPAPTDTTTTATEPTP